MFFVPLQEQFAENTNKSYLVCKVIVVLLIYHKIFGHFLVTITLSSISCMRRPREGAGGPDLTSVFPEIGFCNGRTPPSLRLDPSEKIFWICAFFCVCHA